MSVSLEGSYTEDNETLEYVCRVSVYKGKYYNGIGEQVEILHGDVLRKFSNWFALYREKVNE